MSENWFLFEVFIFMLVLRTCYYELNVDTGAIQVLQIKEMVLAESNEVS